MTKLLAIPLLAFVALLVQTSSAAADIIPPPTVPPVRDCGGYAANTCDSPWQTFRNTRILTIHLPHGALIECGAHWGCVFSPPPLAGP